MSPERQSPRRASATTSSKPYSKEFPGTTLNQLNHIAQSENYPEDKPGFPTYECYKQIETDYLSSLHPPRQAKALISQDMFDRIWDVLHENYERKETSQFRYWARNKFALGIVAKTTDEVKTEPSDTFASDPAPQTILLHENSIVAIQEQIYDIICFGHAATNHGGRDKTFTAVCEHYTWIPKELVANFVKACPTCIAKKCGLPKPKPKPESAERSVQKRRKAAPAPREYLGDLVLNYDHGEDRDYIEDESSLAYYTRPTSDSSGSSAPTAANTDDSESKDDSRSVEPFGPDSDDGLFYPAASVNNHLAQEATSSVFAPGPFDSTLPASLSRKKNQSAPARFIFPSPQDSAAPELFLPMSLLNSDAVTRQKNAARLPTYRRAHSSGSVGRGGLHSLPMSREVSLFQGLPNGWQFQHNDYATACEDFVGKREEDENDHEQEEEGKQSAASSQLSVHSGGGCGRPRVPSVVPMLPAEFADVGERTEDGNQDMAPLDGDISGPTTRSPTLDHSSRMSRAGVSRRHDLDSYALISREALLTHRGAPEDFNPLDSPTDSIGSSEVLKISHSARLALVPDDILGAVLLDTAETTEK